MSDWSDQMWWKHKPEEARSTTRDTAIMRYRNDHRFNAQVQQAVAQAMHAHGPIRPEDADRAACDIATDAAAFLIENMFRNDQELAAQRAIAERYKKLAEDAIALAPMPRLRTPPERT